MEYKYCYVFDYSNQSLFCLNLNDEEHHLYPFDTEDEFIRHWGFHPSQCSWMFTDTKLDIVTINKPLKH